MFHNRVKPDFRLEVFKCTTTKLSLAKTADPNSYSPPMNRPSMRKKASPTSPSAASPAATLVSLPMAAPPKELPAKCTTLFAPSAEHPAKFPSSPEMTVLFIAASVSLARDNLK